jgi:2-dehydro-3-deoxyphosphogluconate aldolase / (4S)-4-hydroxy-2-oxoglutarate aldolase
METMNNWFDIAFPGARVMAILRGYSVERTVELARMARAMGIDCVEVPIQSDTAVAAAGRWAVALRSTVAAGAALGRAVGAGTVITAQLVDLAAEAGAQFTAAPGLDAGVVEASHDAGLPHLPGVATGSDLQLACALGLSWVKAFPASVLGPSWLSAMSGPFPQVKFVATGGINASNAAEYLAAGARVVAVSSALADKEARHELGQLVDTCSTN